MTNHVKHEEQAIEEPETRIGNSPRLENELIKTKHWLSAAFDNTSDLQLLVRIDDDGEITAVDVNNAYVETCKAFGLEIAKDQLIGKTVSTIALDILGFDQSVLDLALRNYHQAAKSCHPVRYEEQIHLEQGTYYSENVMVPIQDSPSGRCQYVLWSSRDITARKLAELKLNRRNQELEALYEIQKQLGTSRNLNKALNIGLKLTLEILNMDIGGIYILNNTKEYLDLKAHSGLSEEYFGKVKRLDLSRGISGHAVTSETVTVINADEHPDPDLAKALRELNVEMALSIPMLSGSKVLGAINLGSFQSIDFSKADLNFMDSIGRTVGICVENAQLFERQRSSAENLELKVQERTAELLKTQGKMSDLLEDVQQAKNTAERKAKELERFSYSVSHDLKAPLRSIDGFSQIIEDEHAAKLDSEAHHCLSMVRRSARQMNQLIDDLLIYSRLDQMELNLQDSNMNELIGDLLDVRRHELEQRHIHIETSFDTETIRSEKEGLRHIIGNILDNAIKFCRENPQPHISIELSETVPEWIIKVKDNGIGFNMKYHDQIFNIFQRLEKSEDYPGTGVGLAIAGKMVDRLGGRIWAESQPNEGSTFFVSLPRPDMKKESIEEER